MELEKKPDTEDLEAELAKPGAEPFHDELEVSLAISDANDNLPAVTMVAGTAIDTAALLDWIDDLRESEEDEEEKIAPSDQQSGMVPDFMPDSAIAIGLEVPDPRNDDDYFFSAARKRQAEEEEDDGDGDGDGGGGGGGGGGDGGDDEKPNEKPNEKPTQPEAAKAPAAAKKPPKKPAAPPPPSKGNE